jgi:hypothetical protein
MESAQPIRQPPSQKPPTSSIEIAIMVLIMACFAGLLMILAISACYTSKRQKGKGFMDHDSETWEDRAEEGMSAFKNAKDQVKKAGDQVKDGFEQASGKAKRWAEETGKDLKNLAGGDPHSKVRGWNFH